MPVSGGHSLLIVFWSDLPSQTSAPALPAAWMVIQITKNFRYFRYSYLKWGSQVPYKTILGAGFPLDEPYIQLI